MRKMSDEEVCKKIRAIAMSKEEFIRGAEESSLFKEVNDEMIAGRLMIDESDAKINRDWSILADQPVTNPIY